MKTTWMVALTAAVAIVFPFNVGAFTRINAPAGATIGVVSVLSPEITNSGGGYTAFSRYSARLTNDWNLDGFSVAKTKELLEHAGYRTIDLMLDREIVDGIADGDDLSDLNYDGLDRNWRGRYEKLIKEHGLAALVVLRENQFPQRSSRDRIVAHGYFVSVSSGFFKATEILVTVTADAIGSEPPHRAVDSCLAREKFDPGIVPVKELKSASISDLASLRARFESLLERKIKFDLASAGLLPESVFCPSWFPGAKNNDPAMRAGR